MGTSQAVLQVERYFNNNNKYITMTSFMSMWSSAVVCCKILRRTLVKGGKKDLYHRTGAKILTSFYSASQQSHSNKTEATARHGWTSKRNSEESTIFWSYSDLTSLQWYTQPRLKLRFKEETLLNF